MAIKDVLRNRRIELQLTMKEVADKVGVSEGTISRWESGDIANMRRDKIMALAKALQISPAVIMEWEEPKETPQAGGYYTDPETARLAQEMFEDPEMRALFHMKRNMKPEQFKAHYDMMKSLYKLEHPEDDDY
jgi:transcriptional regulator with XRE-family HTH domain